MLSIIVAYDKNRGIGINNTLPWDYPEDLRYFRKTTQNHAIAMGSNTFLSIGRALPKRRNIVFSFDQEDLAEYADIEIHTDPIAFFEANKDTDEEIFVIGGMTIYELALPYIQRFYITHIDAEFTVDAYFPEIDFSTYHKISEKIIQPLTFAVYEK